MQMTAIKMLTGEIELLTGLHIGGADADMHIGGIDNSVIKHPVTQEPYIPGSSIKGKMRSLLEWELGVISETEGKPLSFKHIEKLAGEQKSSAENILRLFGWAPEDGGTDDLAKEIGITRLAFWDCSLDREWVKIVEEKNLLLTEAKMENSIDRIKGVAEHPRQTERVPAGAKFEFKLTMRIHDTDREEDLLNMVLKGLRLIELSGLGGSVSRGYGKVRFNDLKCEGQSLDERLKTIPLFGPPVEQEPA